MKNTTQTSRRQFLAAGSLASLGLLFAKPAAFAYGAAKPDSKFGRCKSAVSRIHTAACRDPLTKSSDI
jgi:hypothetical protein